MHFSELDYPSVPDISTCHPFEISMGMPEISYDTPPKMTMLKMPDVKIAPTAIPAVSYDCLLYRYYDAASCHLI